MKNINGRYFFYEKGVNEKIIERKIDQTKLNQILEEEYNNIFVNDKSYYYKHNVYKLNERIKQRIASVAITEVFEDGNIHNTNLNIHGYNIDMFISDNDYVFFLDCEEYKKCKNKIDYFIFIRFNKEMISPIKLNIEIDKLKSIANIKETLNNKECIVSIIGQLKVDELSSILTKERIIPSKSTVNNLKVIDKPVYYIKNEEIKEIDILILDIMNNTRDKNEIILNTEIDVNNKVESGDKYKIIDIEYDVKK